MKLHESVRKVIRQFGANVLSEKRLLFILSDFSAFDEYPAMRQVIEAIVEDGSGKELSRLFLNDDTDWCRSYAQNLRKSLSEKKHFREDFAGYAVDSILFGLGLQSSVTEPSGHGFDPTDHSGAAGSMGAGAGAPQPGGAPAGGPQAPGGAGNGSGHAPGGSAAPGGGSAPSGNGGGSPFRMKWIAAAVLLAGGFVFGWAASHSSGQQEPAAANAHSEPQQPGEESVKSQHPENEHSEPQLPAEEPVKSMLTENEHSEPQQPAGETAKNATLTVWVNGDKGYNGIARVGDRFFRDTGAKIIVSHPDQVEAKFQTEASRGKGPDIFLWSHDRFGEWASAGLIAPLNPSNEERARFEGLAWDAMSVGGKVYGYPFSLEAISLICNKKLVPVAPENWEDFIALDNKLKGIGARAIYWDYTTPYYTYGLISANGGYAFKKSADGFYDVGETGVANEGAKEGVRFLVDLVQNGHMRKGSDYGVMEANFSKGKLGCILNGPWSWSNYDIARINFSVNRLPKLNGKWSRPFVGVQGFVINAASPNKDLAVYFLENYLLTDKGLRDVNDDKAIGPSALKSFEAHIGRDERIAASMENAQWGDPIPSVPEMSRFWVSMQEALKYATVGRQSVDEALETARRRIEP